jgi:ATP-dependent Lon protease
MAVVVSSPLEPGRLATICNRRNVGTDVARDALHGRSKVSGSASIKAGDHDYHLHIAELHNTRATNAQTLATFVALCPTVMAKPLRQQVQVVGSVSRGRNIVPVENLAAPLQLAFDPGAKRILLPMASVTDIPPIPGELFAKFQTGTSADPVDAVFKALGVG